MFYGEFSHTLDNKNRMITPSKFRTGLGESFIITKGLDKCLFVYTKQEWTNFENKMKQLPLTDEDVRRFMRFFFGGASECEPDNQGRVLIPQHLREYAGISKDIVSVGVSSRIEIWSKENWDIYNKNTGNIDKELAKKMAELGI